MFAVVVATGWSQALQQSGESRAACMAPFLGRPFLQHVVEKIAGMGITQLEMILSHLPQDIEQFMGDGTRWGISCRFHLAMDHHKPYATLPAVLLNCQGPGLLAHADRLPVFEPGEAPGPQKAEQEALFCSEGGEAFSGWAFLDAKRLRKVGPHWSEAELERMLLEEIPGRMEADAVLSCRDYASLCQSHWQVLNHGGAGLLLTGQEVEPGIWLSRNVSLHPTARLEPPVWIGEDCRVEQGVKLGPRATVMQGSLLDKRSSLVDSLVFPFSYVGQELEVEQAVVDRNRLVNFSLGASVQVGEAFILGSMERSGFKALLHNLFDRLLAALLLVLGSPLLGLALLTRYLAKGKQTLFTTSRVVKLPLEGNPGQYAGFRLYSLTGRPRRGLDDIMYRFLPGLFNVVKGDLSLAGLAPISPQSLARMPPERIEIYSRAKAGLVEEASVVFGPEGGRDDLYVAEAFYSAKSGIAYDLGLLWKYLLACLSGRHGRPSE